MPKDRRGKDVPGIVRSALDKGRCIEHRTDARNDVCPVVWLFLPDLMDVVIPRRNGLIVSMPPPVCPIAEQDDSRNVERASEMSDRRVDCDDGRHLSQDSSGMSKVVEPRA